MNSEKKHEQKGSEYFVTDAINVATGDVLDVCGMCELLNKRTSEIRSLHSTIQQQAAEIERLRVNNNRLLGRVRFLKEFVPSPQQQETE